MFAPKAFPAFPETAATFAQMPQPALHTVHAASSNPTAWTHVQPVSTKATHKEVPVRGNWARVAATSQISRVHT